MATTVTSPNYWTLTLTSDTASTYNFKFVVDITIDGVVVARIKQPKNLNDSAHMSFEKIVKNYIDISQKHKNTIVGTQYDSIHLMPQNITEPTIDTYNDFFASGNTDSLRLVLFEFYEEYASTEGGVISVNSSGASDITKAIINYADSWEDQKIFDATEFELSTSVVGKFLTTRPTTTTNPNNLFGRIASPTSITDFQTLSFLNSSTYYDTYTYVRLAYRFFTETPNETLGNYIGSIQVTPETTPAEYGYTRSSSATSEDRMLVTIGVGGGNYQNIKYPTFGGYQITSDIKYVSINAQEFNSTVISTLTPADIRVGDYIQTLSIGTTDFTAIGAANNDIGTKFYATGAGTGTGTFYLRTRNPMSEVYLYEIISDANENSSKYEGKNIAWKNKYGVWDYYFFDGLSSDKESYKRSVERENIAGSWNAATFELNTYERGRVDKVEGNKLTTINTRFIGEEWNEHFKGLLMSNEVQIIEGGKSYPINIKNNSFDVKTNLKDKLVQYTFSYEYSHALKSIV